MKKILVVVLLFIIPELSFCQCQMVINGASQVAIVENGGTIATPIYIEVKNPAANAITVTGGNKGFIISENEFNMVKWDIGTNTGTYIVPFAYTSGLSLPLTLNIGTAGTGSGVLKFSTYHTLALNSSLEPSDVTNMTPFFLPGSPSNSDNSYNVVDRFYIIDANTGYTTKPSAQNITFSYISGTASTEVGSPNTIIESHLMAERFNSTSQTWNDWFGYACTDAVVSNVGTVSSGPVPASDLYRSWSLWDDSTPLPITIVGVNATSACINDGSATVTVYGGKSPYTYLWTPTGKNLASATGLSGDSYTVTVTDAGGCLSTAAVTITQPAGTFGITMSTHTNIYCYGGTGSATANAATGGALPYTYSWSPSGGTNLTASNLNAGTYSISANDANGCTAITSVTITQPAALGVTISSQINGNCSGGIGNAIANITGGILPYTYSWSPSGGTNSTASNLAPGSYTITVTDSNTCTATAQVTIAQLASITVTASGTGVLCNGDNTGTATATPAGGTSPYTYYWSPTGGTSATETGLSSGNYTVRVEDINGCSQTATVSITQPLPITTTISSTPVFCTGGDNGTATVTPTGGTAPYNYIWSPGGQNAAIAAGLSAGTYTVIINDANGCSGSATVTVAQPSQTTVAFSSNVVQGCAPLCVQFNNETPVNSFGSLSYLWSFGNGDSSHAQNPVYCYLTGGVYSVELTVTIAAGGCSATLNKINMIKVFSPPNVAFSYSPNPATIISPTIQLTDQSTDPNQIIQWWWTFGDQTDSVSTRQNPTHTYQDTGTYCATLVATDINGCVDTAINCLVIAPLFTLYIPDAFTPNGDGINDVFMAKGTYVKSFEMYVFDRWGTEIFHSTNINNGWNGTVKGGLTVCQEDIYVYKILATDYENKQHSYIGSISLLK